MPSLLWYSFVYIATPQFQWRSHAETVPLPVPAAEPIYGAQFLPRKFKVSVTVPGATRFGPRVQIITQG